MHEQPKAPDVLLQDSLLQDINIGIMTCNMEDMIEWINPYFCDLLSVSAEEIIGSSSTTLMDLDPLLPENASFRIKVKTHENKECWLACVQKRSKDSKQNEKIVRYFTDISDLQRRQPLRNIVSAGYDASRLDTHTGTLNRRAIIQELNNQISRSRRYGNPLSAVLLYFPLQTDMENEDQQAFMQAAANAINANLRWVDIIGTLSAGKLLIILPESDASAVTQAWEKIDDGIKTMTQEKALKNVDYKVNYGAWEQDNSADEMISRLEQSLNQKVA